MQISYMQTVDPSVVARTTTRKCQKEEKKKVSKGEEQPLEGGFGCQFLLVLLLIYVDDDDIFSEMEDCESEFVMNYFRDDTICYRCFVISMKTLCA